MTVFKRKGRESDKTRLGCKRREKIKKRKQKISNLRSYVNLRKRHKLLSHFNTSQQGEERETKFWWYLEEKEEERSHGSRKLATGNAENI